MTTPSITPAAGTPTAPLLSPWEEKLARFSRHYLSIDQKTDQFFARKLKSAGAEQSLQKRFWQSGQKIAQQFVSYDFTTFMETRAPWLKLVTPPRGALVMMMYVGLAYARAHRAWKRGHKEDGTFDSREFQDALRRDLWSITLYIWGLEVIGKLFNHAQEKRSGIRLIHPTSGEIYGFDLHDINARIANQDTLKAHFFRFDHKLGKKDLKEAKGLIDAAHHNSYFGVPAKVQRMDEALGRKLAEHIEVFRNTLKTMQAATNPQQLEAPAETAMHALNQLEALRSEFLVSLKKTAPKDALKLEKHWRNYKDFFAHFAKNQRAPLDLYTFLTVFVLIGWGPVTLNRIWTEHKYQKDFSEAVQKRLENNQAHFNPQMAYQQLKQTSPLASDFYETPTGSNPFLPFPLSPEQTV